MHFPAWFYSKCYSPILYKSLKHIHDFTLWPLGRHRLQPSTDSNFFLCDMLIVPLHSSPYMVTAVRLNWEQNFFNTRFEGGVYQLKWRFPDTVFTEQDSLKQYMNTVWTDNSLLLLCHRTESCHHCCLLLQALETFSNPDRGYAYLKYCFFLHIHIHATHKLSFM